MDNQILAYFVRHGTTAANEANVFRGPLDPPLDENGARDALRLKAFFKTTQFGDTYTSDKLRAQTTAAIILQPHEIEAIPTKQLNAWNVGYLAGKAKDEHQDEIGYFQKHPEHRIPQGESLNEFKDRVEPAILHAINRGEETGKPTLVVTHSSVIHQVGTLLHGDHTAALVRPGGVVAVKKVNGMLKAFPVVRPDTKKAGYGS